MIDNALYTPEMLKHWQEKWIKGGRFSTGNKEIPNAPDQKLGIIGGKTTFHVQPQGRPLESAGHGRSCPRAIPVPSTPRKG
jgi:hypothetical protein